MIHIICGIPGSGKTTVSNNLANFLNAEIINTDIVHKLLFPAGAHTETGDFTPESLSEVYRSLRLLAYYLAKIEPNKNIIFEGSFRTSAQRNNITSILDELHAPYKVILVEVTDDELVRTRLEERLKTGHKGTFQNYLEVKKVFEKPTEAFIIQNNLSVHELLKQIKKYIQNLN